MNSAKAAPIIKNGPNGIWVVRLVFWRAIDGKVTSKPMILAKNRATKTLIAVPASRPNSNASRTSPKPSHSLSAQPCLFATTEA